MTSTLFDEWFQIVNKKFKVRNRKILVFLDNFSDYKAEFNLSNVRVVFFQQIQHLFCNH
jgi:3'-phosphoadenosine 5'-phosphosulfate sulfotransferase